MASLPEIHSCYAIVAPGIEAITAAELIALGVTPSGMEPGGVNFPATLAQLYAANLHLRTATRIIVRIGEFHARTFHELERHAGKLCWERFLTAGGEAEFQVTSRKSKLYHGGAVEQRLLTAVGRYGGTAVNGPPVGPAPAVPSSRRPAQLFIVRLLRDQCTISADASGELLHRRGYRQEVAKAPLRETLAAAMLLGSGWDSSRPLIDPLCGSGTIVIEGALLARRIPPGLNRRFAFQAWPTYDDALWDAMRDEATAGVLPHAPAPILGSDRDAGAIAAAAENAARAGVVGDVTLRRCALSAMAPPAETGWLVTNPPYGVRVGERLRLRDLYAQLGNVVRKRCVGWSLAMLSADPMLERQTGLDFESRFQARNGGLPVRLVSAVVGTSP